jgi:hypothetical protein
MPQATQSGKLNESPEDSHDERRAQAVRRTAVCADEQVEVRKRPECTENQRFPAEGARHLDREGAWQPGAAGYEPAGRYARDHMPDW